MEKLRKFLFALYFLVIYFYFLFLINFSNINFEKLISKTKPSKKTLFISIENKEKFSLRLINIIIKIFPNSSCLHKALLVRYMLIDDPLIKINIGIRKKDNKFDSHAWLEKDGIIFLNELHDLDSYRVILKT